MTLFAPIDPRRLVVDRVQKPTKPLQQYSAAESKALEDHYLACMKVMGCGKKKLPRSATGGRQTGLADRVLQHIHGRWMTCAQIAKGLGVERKDVSNALGTLGKGGYVRTKGLGVRAEHYGLKPMTNRAAKAKETGARYALILSKIKAPMTIAEIARETGLPSHRVRNSMAQLSGDGRVQRIDAAELGMAPSVKFLYGPAEGGAV